MTLSKLINRPCTIVARTSSGSIDELGNAISGETETITVCEIQQRNRMETSQGDWSNAEWVGFFPAGTQLDAGDAVELDDLTYEVIGAPWPARNPRTRAESHVEATLNLTAGAGDAS